MVQDSSNLNSHWFKCPPQDKVAIGVAGTWWSYGPWDGRTQGDPVVRYLGASSVSKYFEFKKIWHLKMQALGHFVSECLWYRGTKVSGQKQSRLWGFESCT